MTDGHAGGFPCGNFEYGIHVPKCIYRQKGWSLQRRPHCLQGICRDSNIPLDHGSGSATFCGKLPAHAVCQFLTVTGNTAYNKSITVCIISGKDTTVTGILSGQGIHSVS